MKKFADLYLRLDRLTATNDKRAALVNYLRSAPEADIAWAVHLLRGGKVGGARARIASSGELREWAAEAANIEPWLFEESYHHVGDLAETITLLLDGVSREAGVRVDSLAELIERGLMEVANKDAAVRKSFITSAWRELPADQLFVFNKLLTGALRVGVSGGLVQQAVSEWTELDAAVIAQRLIGKWEPTAAFVHALRGPPDGEMDRTRPYPFFLASPIEKDVAELGPIEDWLLEWKWDGIRLQLIRRGNKVVPWSRGEERMDGRFPELEDAAAALRHDVVLDGELLAWLPGHEAPAPFSVLQTRIHRLKPSAKFIAKAPVRMQCYDLLELDGRDLRELPLRQRRSLLDKVIADAPAVFTLSPVLAANDWQKAAHIRKRARELGVEGLMLKRRDSVYGIGRKRGDWWKWKIDPLTIDAVLIYAQSGHGRRSALYTDYTFALDDGQGNLVPVAKAYSGLTDKEILELDRWIRANTTERFGPVRAVKPQRVFEIAFEGVNKSSRHKSGVAVRFPRIVRERTDKQVEDADTLASLQALAQ